MLTGISALTLATHDMARAVACYEALQFVLKFGGPASRFTSFRIGSGHQSQSHVDAAGTRVGPLGLCDLLYY
jgi:hypothetical protein